MGTTIAIPLTTNQRKLQAGATVLVRQGEAGLGQDSVALVYQLQVVDSTKLRSCVGTLGAFRMAELELCMTRVLGIPVTQKPKPSAPIG